MDKTRVGKRVASLLLSLVMMLSLLPTAAYATMGNADETQGASVSENGTGVSDDSNSSGNTGDQQVVGGSSGSGTADDTTGAEGGADPTDSANGNDSADPQDDGDAVMPVASSVVSTSEELVAAIAAASDGDTITLGEGKFTTVGNTSPKKSLTFVGAGTGTVWTIGDLDKDVGGEGNGDYSFEGCDTITFNNMTLKVDNKNYRGFIRINNTVVENCTLEGRTAYWGYETAKFVNATFNAPEGDYALWDYSTKDMSFDGCTFNISGKGVHVYVEQPSTDARTIAVNNCKVESTKENKAFLNIKNSTQAYDVTLSGTNTVNGLTADGTTGSALYQVETTKVTETTGNPVTVKQENKAGELETVYEVKETVAETTMDLDAFIKAVVDSGYNYDGNGVTVKWSPVTGCYDTREGHACTANNVKATGNTPKRVSADYAQYQLFSGLTQNVTIKNVKFVYEPAAFTICANSGWAGSGTVTNLAELQFENKGDVKLLDCSFDGVAVAVFNDIETASTVVHGCSFTNMTKAGGGYAIHYLKGGKIDVSENTFENVYRGMLVQSTVNKGTNIVNNNFSGIDATNSSCYMVKLLNVKDTDIVISGNTTAANAPVNVNVAYDGTDGAAIAVGDRISTIHTAETDGNSVKISTGGDQMTGYTAPSAAVEDASGITVDADGNVTVTLPAKTTYVAEVNGVKYKTLQAAIDAAAKNATVTLLADTRENVTISTYGLTLDLNGHTLNGGTVAGKPALTVKNRVTVKDSSEAQTGTIKREDTAANSGVSSHYVIDIQDGWLFFKSGSVTNNSGVVGVKGASLVRVGDDSVAKYPGLTISGGTFTQDNFIVIKVDRGTFYLKEDGTLNSKNSYAVENWKFAEIKGGTVNGAVAAWTYSGGHNSDLTISGGTVNGDVTSVNYGSAEGKVAKVSITGGTVNGALDTRSYDPSTNELTSIDDATKATIAVTGGTFSSDPTKYVVENSGVTPNGDGTFGVAKAYLAKVGDTSYYTMDEAFKAQTASGEAIVLLRDYTTGSTFNSGTVKRTVDLNGHTWTCTGKDANSAAFEINNPNATLIVKNGKVVSSQLVGLIPSANSMSGPIAYDNSTLEFEGVEMTTTAHSGIETNGNNTNDTVTLRNSTLNVPNGFGIYFPSSGTLTIDNSKINAKTMGVQVCSGSLNISGAGTAITVSGDGIDKTINDGAIEDGAAISIVNRIGYKGLDEIKVEGGTFTANGTNAAVKAYDWDNTNKTESDFTQAAKVSVSGGTFSSAVDKSLCAKGYIPTKNADGTYGVKEGQYVAEVNGAKYATLAEAIDAAQDGQTVTLLADATKDVVISKSITLDLGGKTLTNTNAGKATISVTGGTVTVKNGNVVGGTGYYNIEVTKGSNANLTLTDVTATAGNTGSSMIDNWGTLTITSGTYTGGLNVVKSEEGSVLNISGGTFTRETAPRWGITGTVLVYGTTTITGGTFNEKSTSTNARVVVTGRVDGYDSITYVKGGTFNGNGNNVFHHLSPAQADDSFEVSGGTFNKSIPDYYCADGFIPTKNAGGTYGVKEGQYVAKVGSTKYETLADAIKAAKNGKTVTLLADVADCGSLTISKNITLDGGGHTISGNSSISVNMPGKDAADVTIKNVTFKNIANGNKLSAFYFSQVKGKLTITGCTFDSIEYEAIQVTPMEGAEVNVSNNVFKAKADGTQVRHIHIEMAYGSGFDCEGQNIKLTVTDNQLHGAVCGDASMGIWWVGTDSTLKVDGNYMEHPETVSITLSNGGVHYNRGDLIYPARSQADVDVDDLMPAVIVADKASGESKIKAYSTLAEAINAAQDGQTVRLLADVEQNTQLAIDKSITLDLNGKTIKNTADIWGDNTNAILSITNGAKVTITGNGTIAAKENDCYTINVVKGDLTIENGTFVGNISVVQVQKGSLTINGGDFSLLQKMNDGKGENRYLINCIDSEFTSGNAKVAISGGTFVGFDPNVSPEQKVDGKAPSFAAPGVGITKNENGSFTAVDGMTAQILDKDGNSVKAYSTLAEAVAAAEDGQTVRLLADVAESSIKVNANITIDLNKMTVTGSFVTYGEVTIQNGTIDVPDGETNYAYGKLTLADVDITGKAVNSSLLSVNYNGSVTIDKDSTIVADSAKGDSPAVFIKGQNDSGKTYAPELNIYGTVQSAKTPAIQGNGTDRGVSHVNVFEGAVVKSESLAVYLPQPCEVNITGGLVEGYCGIGIKSGTLNISGGTVRGVANDNVIGDQYSQTNGISYDGSAIMIDSYIGYAGQVQINISGNAVVESKYSTAIREIGNDKSQTNLVGLDITGGTVLGAKDTDAVLVRDVTAKDVNISGGEFSSIVKKEYCAPGFTPVTTANSEGRYGVEIGKFTVMVTSRTTGSDSPVANVTGGGSDITYAQGTTVTASAISGYKFVGWFVNEYTGTPYSTDLTCEVKPTDDWTMIAVYEPISGGKFWLTVTASEFTVNGGAVQDSYLYEQFAVGASVTVNFTGSENFLYWVNASNKVVSTEKSYTFIMGSETTLKAVYGKTRQNQATVVFISHSDQIISSKAYTTSDTIQFPVPPIKMGCTFTGWSMTESEIRAAMANNSGIIQVRARYTEPSIACKVTVIYPDGIGNDVVNAVVGKAVNVTAKDIEGKTFSYWTDNAGNVLGYTKTLNLAPSGDMTVKAVYDEAAEAKPVISMTAIDASAGNGYWVVSFTATRAVPAGYEMVKQGILYSLDSRCDGEAGKDYLKLTADGTVPEGVYEYSGKDQALNGVTRFNGKVGTADTTLYGRGYMILKNSAGEVMYVYADTILSGSYNSLNK